MSSRTKKRYFKTCTNRAPLTALYARSGKQQPDMLAMITATNGAVLGTPPIGALKVGSLRGLHFNFDAHVMVLILICLEASRPGL